MAPFMAHHPRSFYQAYALFCVFLILITIPDAVAEQTLRLFVWEGYAPSAEIRRFEEETLHRYGEKVRLSVRHISDPNDFFEAVRMESADIISPTHNLLKDKRFHFIDKNLILPVDTDRLPHYKNLLPQLQHAEYISSNQKVYGVPVAHGPYGLAYNSAILSAPKSWTILWNPAFANRYAISADYYEVNLYITGLALGYKGRQLQEYDALNTPLFRRKLTELIKNSARLWKGVDGPEDLSGLPLATAWGFSFPALHRKGEHWQFAKPDEGTPGWVDNYAICHTLKDRPFLRKVAEDWLNFVISPGFQARAVVRGIGSGPVNLAALDLLTEKEIHNLGMESPEEVMDNRFLWPIINNSRNRNGLRRLWKDALKAAEKSH